MVKEFRWYVQQFLTDPPVWRTDGQTDGRAIAYSALSMLSRAKNRDKSDKCTNKHIGYVKNLTNQYLQKNTFLLLFYILYTRKYLLQCYVLHMPGAYYTNPGTSGQKFVNPWRAMNSLTCTPVCAWYQIFLKSNRQRISARYTVINVEEMCLWIRSHKLQLPSVQNTAKGLFAWCSLILIVDAVQTKN